MVQELINKIADCLVLANDSIKQFRRQNLHAGLRKLQLLVQKLVSLTENIVTESEQLQQWGCDVDEEYITCILSGIMSAQENTDYILVADLLELQLIPWLLQVQEILLANNECLKGEQLLSINLEGLKKRDIFLANQIQQYEFKGNCAIEPTSSGLLTMNVTDETGTYYFHSNVNPVVEGKIFAEQYYSLEHSHYVVFGLGLGYHVRELNVLDDGIYIDIIEPDMEIIKTAFSTVNLSWLYNNPRIRLIYDKDYLKLTDLLKEEPQLVIHYPSLRHVSNPQIKLQLEKFFISDSGKRNMSIQFENNFRDNIVNCKEYVDVLEPQFQDKNAVIVAAGPSLDKNVELLKHKPAGTIIVAVGTVFHKLVDMGIAPDFVIFLDAQPHLYKQIAGLENLEIPIICASTACKRIAASYQGRKYLICQHGYERAEAYAGERGYRLYETGGSVSTIALDLCLQLGCRNVAYIGLDLAFTGNHTHALNTADYAIEDENGKVQVPAADGGMIYASRVFVMYREWIERRAAKEQKDVDIIDATEGGALKKGLKIMTLQETFSLWEQADRIH